MGKSIMKRSAVAATFAAFALAGISCTGEIGSGAPETEAQLAQLGKADMRIAVVGAGPSGLTAAHELEARGYTNVTVFEREDHVGGKVNTIQPAPGVNVEMGAVFASADYPLTLSLASQYGIPTATSNTPRFIYDNGVKRTSTEFLLAHYTPAQIGAGAQAYAAVLQKFPQIFQDKLNHLPADLEQNFDQFVAQYHIEVVADLAKSLVIGFGYGFYDDVPAIYQLKIINMLVKVGPTGLSSPTFFSFPTGYQSLWKAVAADLNVRLNANVTNIVRTGNPHARIRLTVNGTENIDFDEVIVSAPLSAVPNFVTLTPPEKALFKQVTSSRYVVSLIGAPGVTGGEAVFVQDNAVSSQINHVGVWANPNPAFPIYQTWQIADRTKTPAELDTILAADMTSLAGALGFLTKVRKEWPDYFPRVSATAMKYGFYDAVELLQGVGGLFYVGSSLSFETVETSARYAQHLVDERFPVTSPVTP
jgi:protoporphyrinogen/coproporphyrinogen III oxidase